MTSEQISSIPHRKGSAARAWAIVLAVAFASTSAPSIGLAQPAEGAPAPEQSEPAPEQAEASPDAAAPTANEDEAARLLFQSARDAFAAGDYERALAGFQQAYDLSQRPALLYNIGTALDRLRRDEEALAVFEQFLRERPEAPNRAEIESRIGQLRTNVEAARAREEAARLEAERVEQERLAAEEERRQAEEQRRIAEEVAEGGLPAPLTLSVAGAGLVAGALGIVFGVQTRSRNDAYRRYVLDTFTAIGDGAATPEQAAEGRSLYNRARSRQTLTNVFLPTAGAALIGAGIMVFFTDWDGDPVTEDEADGMASFTPSLGVSRRGLDLGMSYAF